MRINESILLAVESVLNEGHQDKESKFKVGDPVHIEILHHNNTNSNVRHFTPHVGNVTKTSNGVHTVEVKHEDNGQKVQYSMPFDHKGNSMNSGTLKLRLVSHAEKMEHEKAKERNEDFSKIHSILDGHKSINGQHHPIPQHHIDQIHELLKKHVAPPEKTSS